MFQATLLHLSGTHQQFVSCTAPVHSLCQLSYLLLLITAIKLKLAKTMWEKKLLMPSVILIQTLLHVTICKQQQLATQNTTRIVTSGTFTALAVERLRQPDSQPVWEKQKFRRLLTDDRKAPVSYIPSAVIKGQ
jgi:hypothetical protein